jgi:hypothetical protein
MKLRRGVSMLRASFIRLTPRSADFRLKHVEGVAVHGDGSTQSAFEQSSKNCLVRFARRRYILRRIASCSRSGSFRNFASSSSPAG